MLQRFLPGLLVLALLPAIGTAETDDWKTRDFGPAFVHGYTEGMEQVRRTGKPPVYVFAASWCGACKKLARTEFKDAKVRAALEYFTPVLIDADAGVDEAALDRYAVNRFPTVVFADSRGRIVKEYRGSAAASKIDEDVRDLAIRMTFDRLDAALVRQAPRRAFAAMADLRELRVCAEQARRVEKIRERVLAQGTKAVETATADARRGKRARARKRLETLESEYAGTPVASAARKALDGIPATLASVTTAR